MAKTEITTRGKRGRAELIAALSTSRAGMGKGAGELADLVNVPKRIKQTLSGSPFQRSAVALIAGLVSSRLLNKKSNMPDGEKSGWLHRLFPDLNLKNILSLLLKSYLEPEKVDLEALLKARLRDYLM